MNSKRMLIWGAFFVALLGVSSVTAFQGTAPLRQSGAPGQLNFQGFLLDPTTGAPVPDGDYKLTFAIYDHATSTDPSHKLWEETQTVSVQDGVFNVILGAIKPIDTTWVDGRDLWLGITVQGEDEMTPRPQLASVPYALNANDVRGADIHPDIVYASNGVQVASSDSNGMYVNSALDDGMHVNSAGHDGVFVGSAGNPSTTSSSTYHNGFEVAGAEGNGLHVGRADSDGVYVTSAGDDGVHVDGASDNGVAVGIAMNNGMYVYSAGGDGVSVRSAGNPSTMTSSDDDHNGFEVAGANGNGLYVGRADQAGVFVDSAALGVVVHSADRAGVAVGSADEDGVAVGSAGNHGVYVNSASYDSVHVQSAGRHGVYVGSADGDGMYVESAVGDGVHVQSAGRYAGYFGGDVHITGAATGFFPRPTWNSDWVSISAGETKTLTHNVGGHPGDYFVDLQCWHTSAGVNIIGLGGDAFPDSWVGIDYRNLTGSTVGVHRMFHDVACAKVRVRIWRIR